MGEDTQKPAKATPATPHLEELRIHEGLVRGLDLARDAWWAKCPFCGRHLVYGATAGGGSRDFETHHELPQCETFQVMLGRAFIEHANGAGARWVRIETVYADAHGGT